MVSTPLSSWGTKGKTGPWLHGQTSQPLAVTAAVAGVRDPLVCQELGLTGVLSSLLPTTLCDESQKTRQTENCGKRGNGQLSFSSCNPRKAKSWSTEITQPMHLQPQRWGNQADKQSVKQLSTNGNDPYKYHVVPGLFPCNMFLKVLSFTVEASTRGAWHHTKLISRVFFNF